MGRGRLSLRDADAETTLSSCTLPRLIWRLTAVFVADEMAKHPRRGWGNALVNSAVSATVFGAAIGLTAYRIWTGGWGSIVHKDALPQEPPPEEDDFEDLDIGGASEPLPPLPFPTSPRSHTSTTPRRKYAPSTGSSTSQRRRYHSSPGSSARRRLRAKRPTIAELLAISAPITPVSADQPFSPESDTSGFTSVSGLSGITGMGDALSPSRSTPTSRTTPTPTLLDPIIGSDASDSDDETNLRLDAMATRVQGLIAEGQAALSSPVTTPRRVPTPRMSDFPDPPPREPLPPLEIPRPRTREGMLDERVSGWDTDTTEEPPRSSTRSTASAASLGYGAPPRSASRPVSVTSVASGSVSGSFQRSASVSSSSSRYQPAVPPLPWRRESFGATSRWVQKQHSPTNSIGSKHEAPLVLTRASPTTSTRHLPPSPMPQRSPTISTRRFPPQSPMLQQSPLPSPLPAQTARPDSASRIPRPGTHSRASSVASAFDSPTPAVRRGHAGRDSPSHMSLDRGHRGRESPSRFSVDRGTRGRDSPSRLSVDRGGWNSPAPPQGLVAARTSLFATVAERSSPNNRSKIPIRRSIGSISSITAVQPSPKA